MKIYVLTSAFQLVQSFAKVSLFMSIANHYIPWLEKIIWVIGVEKKSYKDCCLWLTFKQPVRKPSSESSDSFQAAKNSKTLVNDLSGQ